MCGWSILYEKMLISSQACVICKVSPKGNEVSVCFSLGGDLCGHSVVIQNAYSLFLLKGSVHNILVRHITFKCYFSEGLIFTFGWDDNNDNLILITMECPFFPKRNSLALLLNKVITHTLTHESTHCNLLLSVML